MSEFIEAISLSMNIKPTGLMLPAIMSNEFKLSSGRGGLILNGR